MMLMSALDLQGYPAKSSLSNLAEKKSLVFKSCQFLLSTFAVAAGISAARISAALFGATSFSTGTLKKWFVTVYYVGFIFTVQIVNIVLSVLYV